MTLSEILFDTLKRLVKQDDDRASIYYHLFKLQSKESLENILQRTYSNRNKYGADGNWFALFHKEMRQVDWYPDTYHYEDKQRKENLSGHMDMVIYNLICIDEGFLYKWLGHIFDDYTDQPKDKTIEK